MSSATNQPPLLPAQKRVFSPVAATGSSPQPPLRSERTRIEQGDTDRARWSAPPLGNPATMTTTRYGRRHSFRQHRELQIHQKERKKNASPRRAWPWHHDRYFCVPSGASARFLEEAARRAIGGQTSAHWSTRRSVRQRNHQSLSRHGAGVRILRRTTAVLDVSIGQSPLRIWRLTMARAARCRVSQLRSTETGNPFGLCDQGSPRCVVHMPSAPRAHLFSAPPWGRRTGAYTKHPGSAPAARTASFAKRRQ